MTMHLSNDVPVTVEVNVVLPHGSKIYSVMMEIAGFGTEEQATYFAEKMISALEEAEVLEEATMN